MISALDEGGWSASRPVTESVPLQISFHTAIEVCFLFLLFLLYLFSISFTFSSRLLSFLTLFCSSFLIPSSNFLFLLYPHFIPYRSLFSSSVLFLLSTFFFLLSFSFSFAPFLISGFHLPLTLLSFHHSFYSSFHFFSLLGSTQLAVSRLYTTSCSRR